MANNLVQPLQPFLIFVNSNQTLTREAYDFLNNLYLRVGGSLSDLNAATLQDGTWQSPGTIGSTTPNTGDFTTLSAVNLNVTNAATLKSPTITTGVNNNGSGLKHARITTGSIGATSDALVTITWASAFANANYTVTASVVDSTASGVSLRVVHVETVSASQVQVRVENTSAGPLTGTLHVIAMHD